MVRLIFIVLFSFFTMTANSQNSAAATVNSRATIIDPIKITKSVDLDFGNVISAFNPGKVVLSPNGNRIAQGVQISSTFPGNVAPAEAIVNHGNNKYSISLPNSFTLYSQEDPSQILIIDEFKVDPTIGETLDVLKIGATLNLEANQPSGFYTNSSGFNVTVSYN
ncbi:DUF4402 domain-containing protein [Salinimicrobium gaetbulicola]|uniref:DUF4402 domain-containing protein n=1 Tax=Salinimicrobium gaetbulicola TaxID=999702 RepID=A0ABW3IC34_9FLAO